MRFALPISLSLITVLALGLALPSVAAAKPFSREPDDRPWTRGTLMPSFGLGGSFYSGGGGNLVVGAGLRYFFVNNLGLGLQLQNFTTFLPRSYKEAYPGIEKQIPTNEFSMIPGVTVMLYRSYRFTPYVHAGVGPVFLNHKRGVVGEWNAGPGFLIGLGRMFALDLGVNFSMRFPGDKCESAFTYAGSSDSVFFNACGLRWGIRAGLVFGFGVGRKRNPPPQPADPYAAPAPASPGYVAPAPPPQPAPEPQPVVPAEPELTDPNAPPPADPAQPVAPPGAPPGAPPPPPTTSSTTAPGTAPPPGESVPITPPPG